MANISKKAAKKAHKREKHLLAKQTAQPEIQIATKSAPITATSPPVSSNTATSTTTTIATGTVKTVAELDAKFNCTEQQWAQTSTSPFPEGLRNAVMAFRAALVIQEAAAVQPVGAPVYNVQVSEKGEKREDVKGGNMSEKMMEMESTKRGGEEQEKESGKEEKVKEVYTIRGDTNDATSSQNPADNECMITPTASPRRTHARTLPKHAAASPIVDATRTMARTATNGGVRGVSDDVTYLARSSFDWAEDVDATVTPTPIALVAPAAHAPRDFSVLRSNNRNPWGSLSRRHHRSQPRICNSFNSRKYNTNYAYKPTTPSSAPAPVHLVETIRHPCGIAPTKPVIRTSSAVSTPILHSSMSTHSCEPLSAVRSDSSLWPSYTPSFDWSGDPLLAGLARILEALGWTRGCVAARTPLCLRGAHGVVGFGGADPLVA